MNSVQLGTTREINKLQKSDLHFWHLVNWNNFGTSNWVLDTEKLYDLMPHNETDGCVPLSSECKYLISTVYKTFKEKRKLF